MTNFFHVLVNFSDGTGPRVLFFDLSEKELQKQFLSCYRRGKRVFVNGEIIDLRSVSIVNIVKTSEKKDESLKALQKSSQDYINELNRSSRDFVHISAGRGWNDEEIVDCGDDVTTKYIKSPPGEESLLALALSNQWVVGTATAVISALILALIFGIGS